MNKSEITAWHQEYVLPPKPIEHILTNIKIQLLRLVAFFRPAPLVAGIDPEIQKRNQYLRLLLQRLIPPQTFEGIKTQALSNHLNFLPNQRWFTRNSTPSIDDAIIPLSYTINEMPDCFISDSCSGHVYQNPHNSDECVIKPNGYITIHCNNEKKFQTIWEIIVKLCKNFNANQEDLKFNCYKLEDPKNKTYHLDIQWAWKSTELKSYYRIRRQKSLNKADQAELYKIAKKFKESSALQTSENFITKLNQILTLTPLQERFQANPHLQEGLNWDKIKQALCLNPKALWSINQMEEQGHEPNIYHFNQDGFYIGTCSLQTPESTRGCVYDKSKTTLDPQPLGAIQQAQEIGVQLMTPQEYRILQQAQQEFDLLGTESETWLKEGYTAVRMGSVIHYNQNTTPNTHHSTIGWRGSIFIPWAP